MATGSAPRDRESASFADDRAGKHHLAIDNPRDVPNTVRHIMGNQGWEARLHVPDEAIEVWAPPFTDGDWATFDGHVAAAMRDAARMYRTETGNHFAAAEGPFRDAITAMAHKNKENPPHKWMTEIAFRVKDDLPPVGDDMLREEQRTRDTDLIAGYFAATWGVDPTSPWVRWCACSTFVGVVDRILRPGRPHRVLVILIGAQGCGKSSFLRKMLPDGLERYFVETSLTGDPLESAIKMRGKVLGEIPEMVGARRAEMARLKGWMTSGTDHVRLKYDRRITILKRTMYGVGTANPMAVIPRDPTGSTRFAVLQLPGTGEPRKTLPDVRDDLWEAAARLFWLHHEPGHMPDELAEHQRDTSYAFESHDDDLIDAVMNLELLQGTVVQLAHEAGILEKDRNSFRNTAEMMRWADALRQCRWTKTRMRRLDGKRPNVWSAPFKQRAKVWESELRSERPKETENPPEAEPEKEDEEITW